MCTQDSKRFLAGVTIALAVLLAGAGQVRAQFTFGEPENLGPVVNSSSRDQGQTLSSDGLTIIFYSDRPGSLGEDDLWMTTRASAFDPWQPPENLGPTINSSYGDGGPSVSADGLTLFFGSNRPGGFGSADLHMTTRARASDPWQPPVNLGPTVNSSSADPHPSISADGLTLYFASARPGGSGAEDLWQVAPGLVAICLILDTIYPGPLSLV